MKIGLSFKHNGHKNRKLDSLSIGHCLLSLSIFLYTSYQLTSSQLSFFPSKSACHLLTNAWQSEEAQRENHWDESVLLGLA